MVIGLVALVANVSCLLLIYGHREGGAHMKASWIFSANDVIANIGVIAAGALDAWTGSSYPDLVIGTVVGLIVLNGARRILALQPRSEERREGKECDSTSRCRRSPYHSKTINMKIIKINIT